MSNPIIFSYIKNNLETKAFFCFSIFFFLIFQSLSYFSLWTETEIYPAHSAQYLFTENMLYFLFALKPIFYSTLHLSFLFSDWLSLPPMTGGRFLFALNGLITLALMYLYIKKKTDKYNAILAVLLFASMNIFLDRGFRIRSDFLSTSFSLIALLTALSIKTKREHWKFYLIIPLLLSTLMISPKAIYWICFTLCLILYDLKGKTNSNWPIATSVFGMYMIFYFLSFFFKDPFFIKSIYQSTKFYSSNVNEAVLFISEYGWIKSLFDFSHVGLFIERNKFIFILILIKILFVIFSTIILKKRKWNLSDLYFLILLSVLLFHPKQRLFFLCAVTPFVFISFFTDWQWKQLINHGYGLKFKTLFLAGVFLYSFYYISHFTHKVYTKRNNRPQKELVGKLNAFYENTDPLIAILDPFCILYSRKTDCRYILDDENWKKIFQSYLKKHNFDIILGSRFLDLFKLIYYKRSSFQYINIKNHIYYKAFIVDSSNRQKLLEMEETKDQISAMPDNSVQSAQELINIKSTTTSTQNTDLSATNSPASLSQSQSEQNLETNQNPPESDLLKGKTLLQFISLSLETKAPEQSRKYSYLFLDSSHNEPLTKKINCRKKKENFPVLQQGCAYNKEEFEKGQIQMGEEKLAVFYLPIPIDLPEGLSLAYLFRYDMF